MLNNTFTHRLRFNILLLFALQFLLYGCANRAADNQGANNWQSPDELYGELFTQAQMAGIYNDSKTFVDSTPKYPVKEILAAYHSTKDRPDFHIKIFVDENFDLPPKVAANFKTDLSKSAAEHTESLWDVLVRQPDTETTGSLIPLPHSYVVPGDRFREIYYWDSYFTMLGLQASGRWELIEAMVNNFSYLIDTLGFIPNGNRTYYLGRSQPPFYSLMVRLLAEKHGKGTLSKYRAQLLKEYEFWMDGTKKLTPSSPAYRRVVRMQDGEILNRYWDDLTTPRPESYKEDRELVEQINTQDDIDHDDIRYEQEKYRHIRAAAESGWDFSSRWFKDGVTMQTIRTTEIIPIDLNALLYHLEMTLADAFAGTGDNVQTLKYRQLAQQRKQALLHYCWNTREGFFYDYDFVNQKNTPVRSLAAVYPLFFNMVDPVQAEKVAQQIEQEFLQKGGVTTTLKDTDQQWDAPNGWAPLQWLTIQGLRNYQQHQLADTIKHRWVQLNTNVYQRSGKMVEKYNVYELGLEAGGGEYPVQDGFGWTNGVLLKLLSETPETIIQHQLPMRPKAILDSGLD